MDSKLIADTRIKVNLLMDPRTGIDLALDEQKLAPLAELLDTAKLSKKRKIAILGSYMLLYLGLTRHEELEVPENEERTRRLLAGDYLFGGYIRWLVQFEERELLTHLSPVHKKIQIGLASGLSLPLALAELDAGFRTFVERYSQGQHRTRRPQ